MWQKHICVAIVRGEMGLYQHEIIIKPCLINENVTHVSVLIYQKEHNTVPHDSEANVCEDGRPVQP